MKPSVNETNNIRLQVFLSRCGVCSRRNAMELIQSGKVSVNDRIVFEPSTPVDPQKDKVCVDKKLISSKQYEYILLNKPAGYTTTSKDPFAKKTVFDLLPKEFKKLNPVGRLDKDTEGLLIFTNDGDLAYKLTHPKFNIDKVYKVIIVGQLKPESRAVLEKGVVLDGKKTATCKISDIRVSDNQTTLLIKIHEGRKRQVRLMFGQIKHFVRYLKREEQGPVKLGSLKLGKWRQLTSQELRSLKAL
ncbi:MAG: pseudouridine synthase [Candidatus Omnitrophica bacterium]|nr:pseudouridine synthase [Candidatus Omnitrophota bacterium]